MDDSEENYCKVEYLDVAIGQESEETNWIKHGGRCRVTYPNGDIFEGLRHKRVLASLVIHMSLFY